MNKSLKILLPSILLATLLAGCGGPEDRARTYLEKGRELIAERNFVKAKLEIQNALQIKDDMPAAWLAMAELQEATKDYQGAFASYNRVVALNPESIHGLIGRGRIYLAAKQVDKAREDAEAAAALGKESAGLTLLQAGLAVNGGDRAQARTLAEKALQLDPAYYRARIFLAVLGLQPGSDIDGEGLLRAGVDLAPNQVELWEGLALWYQNKGPEEQEIAALEQLVALQPEDPKPVYRLSSSLAKKGQLDDAEKVLRDRLAAYPDESETGVLLGNFLVAREGNDPDQAFADLDKLIAEYPKLTDLRFLRVKMLLSQKRVDDAKAELQKTIDAYRFEPAGMKARKQLAGLLIAEGKREEGERLIAEVLEDNPRDGDALVARAAIALSDKNTDAAISDLRVALADRPDSEKANDLIVRAFLMRGETDQAANQLARYIENAPTERKAYVALAELYTKLGRTDEAEPVLKRMAEAFPDEVYPLRALSQSALRRGDMVDAMTYATQLRDAAPEKPEGHYALGVVYQAAGDHPKAIEALRAALERQPDAIEPLTALVRSHLALDQADQATAELEALVAKNPQHYVAYNLLGELARRDKDDAKAAGLFEQASSINPKWVVPYVNRAQMLRGSGDAAGAIAVLRDAKAATEQNPIIGRQLAVLLQETGDKTGAIAEYEALLEKQPDAGDAANNLAALLSEPGSANRDLDRAYELARGFAQSDNALFRDTLGWVLYQRGDVEGALPHFEFAVNAKPELGELQYHLGKVYADLGRKDEARVHLERALATGQAFPGAEDARQLLGSL